MFPTLKLENDLFIIENLNQEMKIDSKLNVEDIFELPFSYTKCGNCHGLRH